MKETFEKIETTVAMIKEDLAKLEGKGNKAAGTRSRKNCQELKKLCQTLRIQIQELKKAA